MDIKNKGQVFTPNNIVCEILDFSNYNGKRILKKHIIDNSCGEGAFLIEIVKRYIKEFKSVYKSLKGIENDLKKYIHGVEIDKNLHKTCIDRLNSIVISMGLNQINWDIVNGDSLIIKKFDGKMDFVVGNPPYVRIHNLEDRYEIVKNSKFCQRGMTDLFLIFFEIGFKMMNKNGILAYITPNSYFNSVAGRNLRMYFKNMKSVELIADLGHAKVFNATTYTSIIKITNKKHKACKIYLYDDKKEEFIFKENIEYNKLFIDEKIILPVLNKYKKIMKYKCSGSDKFIVKNGYATLCDKVFINDRLSNKKNIIKIIKASTAKWTYIIYPYNKKGELIKFDELDKEVQKYLIDNKQLLKKRSLSKGSHWYEFGRTQGIKDTYNNKYSINTIVKDKDSIYLNEVKAGEGVYSGLYILTDVGIDLLIKMIKSDNFIEYVKSLKKYKNGGYYTFSSKDLEKYLNYMVTKYE